MKFVLFVSFILIAAFASFADSAATKVQCFDKNTNHHWAAGTEYRPIGQCVRIMCNEKGEKAALTCAVAEAGPNCSKVAGNVRKAYPECCPTFNCKKM